MHRTRSLGAASPPGAMDADRSILGVESRCHAFWSPRSYAVSTDDMGERIARIGMIGMIGMIGSRREAKGLREGAIGSS